MHKSRPLVKLLRTEWTDRGDGRAVKAPTSVAMRQETLQGWWAGRGRELLGLLDKKIHPKWHVLNS